MKMRDEYFNKKNFFSLLLFLFVILGITGFSMKQSKKESSVKITHGNIIFEVNSALHTRISSSFPDSKTVMDKFQASENITIDNRVISNFELKKVQESTLDGKLSGREWLAKGIFEEDGLKLVKNLKLTAYDDFPNLISVEVKYVNASKEDVFIDGWINGNYQILPQGDQPPFWAFQGSSSSSRSDWIKPLEPGYYQKNYMGMNDSDYGGGIPVTSVWRPDLNIAVGHLSLVPELVNLPTEMLKDSKVVIGVSNDFAHRTLFKAQDTITTLETFVSVSKGDYFENLAKYSELMQEKGIKMVKPEEAAFEPIWCAWGYGREFTMEEVVNTLPKVKELGIDWAVLDDGFQVAEGDWEPASDRFPEGEDAIKKLVERIHGYGLKAKIWWTPLAADPGSKALEQNPQMIIKKENGAPQFITWWDAYYLSPTKEETVKHTKDILDLFLNQWDFDGLKMDGQHLNAVAPDHTLENPEEAPKGLPDFFHMIYNEARKIKPNAVVENCPCGTCMSYYNMASTNQTVSSDPLSSWQIRHKGKTYKALVPQTAYYGDHVELSDNGSDFASSFGIGAVLGTKFTVPSSSENEEAEKFLLTERKEEVWKKWFTLYNDKMLSKEEYIGNLYDIGYDKPETHVIKKQDRLYYAFYADFWEGKIEFRGLENNTEYRIVDYFNKVNLEHVKASQPFLDVNFKEFILLEAVPVGK
ncbi:glycoside hydrolase family 36 protein [Salegentibacter flavus]|uniref:Alpha-galactosidase n=1 Tax=Salegentibacter flavus TaxID=287099 RepID=A0A1I4ZKB3_9FLAO|nr:glycoside hydrolase family 36 protein [Salegentibacter flavus]SFN50399.1 alpha-galactosidase [Salegentibacter flavus]